MRRQRQRINATFWDMSGYMFFEYEAAFKTEKNMRQSRNYMVHNTNVPTGSLNLWTGINEFVARLYRDRNSKGVAFCSQCTIQVNNQRSKKSKVKIL